MTREVSMRDVFGQTLVELGAKCPELVVLDADVSSSTRTAAFGKTFPDRFFNLGVAEANMVDVAAGMATCGLRPVASTFALFMALKAGEQVRQTVSYNNLPVVLAGAYGGLSDSYDGASHQSVLDIAIMRAMPNMTVVVPADGGEVAQELEAALRRNGPTYIRLGRNPTPLLFEDCPALETGKARVLREGADLTIAVCGVPTFMAIDAAESLAEQGVEVEVIEFPTLKPFDAETLAASARKTCRVLTVEEHSVCGGLAGAVSEALCRSCPVLVDSIGMPDCYPESGEYFALMAKYGISAPEISARGRKLCGTPARK